MPPSSKRVEQIHFIQSEHGAVTVDWVVLTAGLVGLGLATMAVVSGGVEDLSSDVNTQLRANNIITSSFVRPAQLVGVDDTGRTRQGEMSCEATGDGFVCAMAPVEDYVRYITEDGDWLLRVTPRGGEEYWEDADGNVLKVPPVAHPDGICPLGALNGAC